MASLGELRIGGRRPSIYNVVTSIDYESDLVDKVNACIADGWEPLGGVSVTLSESDDYRYVIFAQAMVIYK